MFHRILFFVAFRWSWFARMVSTWLTDDEVQKIYKRTGEIFGCAVSYLYMGEAVGFENMLNTWAFWEREYARRGFVTLSVNVFQ